MIINPPFTYQKIEGSAGVSFRVTDGQDNRVATCYLEENAEMVTKALNIAYPVAK